jgi:hypothetical protein
MSTKGINVERIRRFASSLTRGDIAMLANSIEFRGTDAGFKERLPQALSSSYDADRSGRLLALIRGLNEAELIWLCENHDEVMHRR